MGRPVSGLDTRGPGLWSLAGDAVAQDNDRFDGARFLGKDGGMVGAHLDFRSDTVTRPTPGMKEAMANAEVGDDVFGDDPSVHRLERRLAEILGKEASLFVPSGTMSNQIGIRVHCRPGDEILCEAGCHLFNNEQGGYAQLSGVAVRPVPGTCGVMELDQLVDLPHPDDPHLVRTRLVCLENTHNRGGGRILPYENVEAICAWAHQNGLATHLDGARLFNAVVGTGIEASRWAQHFDTVNVCFSKGLGAPIGSALAGSRDLIAEAVRHRKVLGGGMRQAGFLAAAALYALERHVDRLAEDHANAQRLADGIRGIDPLRLEPETFDTNIVYYHVDPTWGTAQEWVAALKERGLWMVAPQRTVVRAVTHLDVDPDDVDQAIVIMKAVARSKR